MPVLNRRGLLVGLISSLAAPAIVHAGNLMPIKVFAERIVMGDMFYSFTIDVLRVAAENGWDNKPIHWHEISALDVMGGRVLGSPVIREILPDHFKPGMIQMQHQLGEV